MEAMPIMCRRFGNVVRRAGVAALFLAVVGFAGEAQAQRQYDGLCAIVKIEILQELALERTGFLATLKITNNEVDANITDFAAELTFKTGRTAPDSPQEDASDRFFVQTPTIFGTNAIDGTGIIRPGETATVQWFIIPKIAAGGTTPQGNIYEVGARLSGRIFGEELPEDSMLVLPDIITVLPEPQLEITYFQPRDVTGDNPFTLQVEAPIPFTLGVLVKNAGAGTARKVNINSEQPRILDNQQGLILVAQLLGALVDDQPLDRTSLNVNLGDIAPGRCRKGAWKMITSLSGEFVEFKATYTHAPELGGEDTSVIKSLNAYFIVHEVLNDQPGRDALRDFLAMTDVNPDLIPDTLFETDCNELPVNRLQQVQLMNYTGTQATIEVNADFENWIYIRLDDPAQAKFPITSVLRSDGRVLNANNYWTNIRYDPQTNAKLTYLNIFDFVQLGQYTYTVNYQPTTVDNDPPVTTLEFNGVVSQVNGNYVITADTQMFFLSDDESPVAIYYKFASDVDFVPGLPFRIEQPGVHVMEYFAQDSFGNEEAHKFATLILSDDPPQIANVAADGEDLFIAGDAVSVRPQDVSITFDASSQAGTVTGIVDVFSGAYGFPSLSGVPSSPTPSGNAAIVVGGENVDFYKYSVNGAPFSAETSVVNPINLAGLAGAVQLRVLGRSQHGAYPADTGAVEVTWTVNGAVDPIGVEGPPTPTRSRLANLTVTGTPLFCYRVDGWAYFPEPAGGVIELIRLADGPHMVEIVARADISDPCPGNVPGDYVYQWTVDHNYGFALPPTQLVRSIDLGPLPSGMASFSWDGRDNAGVVVPPGWYSIRMMVADALGRDSSALKLVHVGDLLADGTAVADTGNANQKEPHAAGAWAVWQDQRNGSWDIFALKLDDPAATSIPVSVGPLNKERPRTDGVYAVWQDRQADGSSDIWARKVDGSEPAFPITQTSGHDERRPFVDWPWVVFERKPLNSSTAPWQLVQHNMLTMTEAPVDTTTQDQLEPVVHAERVVWTDFRDVGPGEIYLKNLRTGAVQRITDNPGGQIQPYIYGHWIVWADNRIGNQLDLYGHNLLRGVTVQLTDTPYDESRPFVGGKWVAFAEDSPGGLNRNLRILSLHNHANVQLTNAVSGKDRPAFGANRLVWRDQQAGGPEKVLLATLPDLQPVFNNQNTVAVTRGMVDFVGNAFTLLEQWAPETGVMSVTRYTALMPTPVSETASWDGAQPTGSNFSLEEGSFLWVKFDGTRILDLGQNACESLDLNIGANVFGYTCFPRDYTAYALIRELGAAKVKAVRTLDSETGQWKVASVASGAPVGADFEIAPVAVVMIDMNEGVADFKPGAP